MKKVTPPQDYVAPVLPKFGVAAALAAAALLSGCDKTGGSFTVEHTDGDVVAEPVQPKAGTGGGASEPKVPGESSAVPDKPSGAEEPIDGKVCAPEPKVPGGKSVVPAKSDDSEPPIAGKVCAPEPRTSGKPRSEPPKPEAKAQPQDEHSRGSAVRTLGIPARSPLSPKK